MHETMAPVRRLALLIATMTCGACAPAVVPANPPRTVVLVTIDTLRADALGTYGSRTTKTPAIDELAREGVTYDNAAAPMPITRPSHFTIFTSMYPRSHGVVDNELTLPADVPTVTETFAAAGYRTAAFTGVSLLSPDSGIGRGFQTFDYPRAGTGRAAHQVVRATGAWVRALAADDRAFLWMHLFDPHMPYEPSDLGEDGGLRSVSWRVLQDEAARHGGDLPASVRDRARFLYDREVEHATAAVGELVSTLRAAGRWKDAVVVFTADHGECFENGIYFEHAECLYDGAIRVPLVVRAPGRAVPGTRFGGQVEHLGIAPTLLDAAGLKAPDTFKGRSLLARDVRTPNEAFFQHPMAQGEAAARRNRHRDPIRSIAGERHRRATGDGRELVGVRTPEWKLIQTVHGPELYQLALDPHEKRNLAGEAGASEHLERDLAAWQRALPIRRVGRTLTPELEERLRALGYVQ